MDDSGEQRPEASACYIHDVPTEILVFILNGNARSPRGASEAADALPPRGDARDHWIDRPLLDGRWRFAARAVCRTWRRIIGNPSLADAAALDAYRPFAVHSPMWTRRCPKWATGRIVCLTAAADTIAANAALWARDPEAVADWCRIHAGATRKQAIAALVASGVPWAVDAVVDHHWPLISFSDQQEEECPFGREDSPVAARASPQSALQHGGGGQAETGPRDGVKDACASEARPRGWGIDLTEWLPIEVGPTSSKVGWEDDRGEVAIFLWTLLAVALRRGLYAAFRALQSRFACRAPDYYAALEAISGNQPDLFAAFVGDAAQKMDDVLWYASAEASDPSCLARLLDMAAPPAPRSGSTVADWLMRAVRYDRPRVFALLDARGMAFDAAKVANTAAQCGSVGVLAYMVSRDRRLGPASPAGAERLDMAALAWEAVVDDGCASGAGGIKWLCGVGGYAPRPGTDDLRRLVERAYDYDDDDDYSNGAGRIVYMAERWPRAFAALPASTTRNAFGHCVRKQPWTPDMPARLARVLDAGTDPVDRDAAIRDLDLWSVVVSNLQAEVEITFAAGTLFLALCRMARGGRPRASDTGDVRDRREPCHCIRDPSWRHQDEATRNMRDPTTDADVPCSDAALERWTPLGRWCAARPVRVSAIFPGWTAPAHDPVSPYTLDAMDDLHKLRLVAEIDALGFLLPEE
ncbi:hypothetical protein pdul_cds_901 [Pandoravirus dulcis]|uniref:F-box incomplete domain containing protein n=1 Tax=Pandoravirus dulcis TaxID=1349409 RepID=S4VS62_9VIRU|nr:hypothetical protein pdul_cds_901 [Pandoravirus dulcis]AGO83132.1 hypothetical protein pdul_cds_901 [Pandoravirus dulcis]